MNTKLWYTSPAKGFTQALPLGNGSLGAIVYGGVPQEQVDLNLDTFWSGTGRRKEKPVPREKLEYARSLIFEGKYRESGEYIEQHLLGDYNESYLPFATLDYDYCNVTEYSDYQRSLDLTTAILETTFRSGSCQYHCEMFASYPDKVLAMRISVSEGSSLSLKIRLSSKVQHTLKLQQGHLLSVYGNAPTQVLPNYVASDRPIVYDPDHPGMAFCGTLAVSDTDGKIDCCGDFLRLEGASYAVIYFSATDGYQGYQMPPARSPEVCLEKCAAILMALSGTYEEIKRRHIEDYQVVYKAVELRLGEPTQSELPTDVRLERFRQGADRGLPCLFFHYGRYLMIASSRQGSQPANLQGIWNDCIRPAWSSNWTTNINTEMNYWPAGPGNLLDCYEPFARLLKELSDAGVETASGQYHCGGWAVNHNVDIWRQTGPAKGLAKYAYWPMGGVWLSAQLFDYFKFTNDKAFLKEHIYPVMQGAAAFCLDWLVPRNGSYDTAPSTSPENTFLDKDGNVCSVGRLSTLDLALIKELFKNIKAANEVLAADEELLLKIDNCLKDLPEYPVGQEGRLLEWRDEFEENTPGHRHFSPMFALYPGTTINREDTPRLAAACRAFIEKRLAFGGGHIGWSCAWLISLFAKLGDGEQSNHYLEQLLANSLYENLFDLHPPLGEREDEQEVFQIDGNFGGISGILNMLLQSGPGYLELLPALPKLWQKGSVKNLLAEGGICVSMAWENGVLQWAELLSNVDSQVSLRYRNGGAPKAVELKKNQPYHLKAEF